MPHLDAGDWLAIIEFAILAGVAFLAARTGILRESNRELRDLADTRGKRIEDLEKKVDALSQRVEEMKNYVVGLQRIKSQEIATDVFHLLKGQPLPTAEQDDVEGVTF